MLSVLFLPKGVFKTLGEFLKPKSKKNKAPKLRGDENE
jgi:hypothetical protein